MNMRKIIDLSCRVIFILLICQISGCHVDSGQSWKIKIGGKYPKLIKFVDGEVSQKVRVCLDRKGGSGYPITVVISADGDSYSGILNGQCMFFEGKRVDVRFGTPTSGMYAEGTYRIIEK